MSQPYRIAIAGLGTVGVGVIEILQKHAELLSRRTQKDIVITHVSAQNKDKDRGVDLSNYTWVENTIDLAECDCDAVIELIGGSEGIAYDLVRASLQNGKSVITANKALIAHHGIELCELAENNNIGLAFEASVAGGIPIIKAIKEGFAANDIRAVYGVLNGTCNYILTEMTQKKAEFQDALSDAQEKGYAEADPAFDIEGTDAGHKLAILTSLCFGTSIDFSSLSIRGITDITSIDISYADQFGYKIKLLGIAKSYGSQITQGVEPCLVPKDSKLGLVEGVYNAVEIEGDFVGDPILTGLGAGKGATASSVVADVIDIVRGNITPGFGMPVSMLQAPVVQDVSEIKSRYYMRLMVKDESGVIAAISTILKEYNISIENLYQQGKDSDDKALDTLAVVITTHQVKHQDITLASQKIMELEQVKQELCMLRIEDL